MKKVLLSMLAIGAVALTAGAQATGSADAPLSVTEFLAQGTPASAVADTYVQGYIVGYVDGQVLASGAKFDLTSGEISNTNILLAASSSEDNVEACIPVQLPSGTIRSALSLAAHPENLYHEVVLCGSHEKYFSANGLKSVTSYKWIGDAPVPDPSTKPGVESTGTKENPLTVTKFLELGATPTVADAWLTGVIVGSVTGISYDTAEMGASANSSVSNILVAATANPTSANECVPIQLPAGSDVRAALNLKDNPDNVGKTIVICGSREAYFGVTGLKTPTFFTLDGETVAPEGAFYSGLSSNADDWTINVGEIPEGLNYVWAWDAQYGLKASAFYNNTSFPTDVWAVSPVIDLTEAANATLSLSQAINYLKGNNELLTINVKEENGNWAVIKVTPAPETDAWTFVDGTASLDAYVGKKIQLGFDYISTAEVAATWEIKNVKVTGDKNPSGVEAVAADKVYVAGNAIVAPAGARVFNLSGVETGLNNLPAGIYVVVVADKAVKVLVK